MKTPRWSLIALVFYFAAVSPALAMNPAPGQTALRAELDRIFDATPFASAFWGVRVEDASGAVLYDRNGGRNFVPASNMKIFTTAAALALLGADFQYETRLDAVGEMGENGLWEGSLVIVGSGDPCLGSWHIPGEPEGPALLAQWVESVRAAGIRTIRGDIVGDGRAFSDEYISGNWELEDYPFWYAAGSSGLAFEENCFRFTTSPGKRAGDPAKIVLNPDTAYVKVINETLHG